MTPEKKGAAPLSRADIELKLTIWQKTGDSDMRDLATTALGLMDERDECVAKRSLEARSAESRETILASGRLAPKPLHMVDAVTGQHFEVTHGDAFTRISVDGRDYYFTLDGSFDGTGMGPLTSCRVSHLIPVAVLGGTPSSAQSEAEGEFGNTSTSRLLPNSGQSGVASRKKHDSDTSVDNAQKEGRQGEPTCVHNNPQCRCSQLKRLRIMREGDEPANPGEQIEGAPSS